MGVVSVDIDGIFDSAYSTFQLFWDVSRSVLNSFLMPTAKFYFICPTQESYIKIVNILVVSLLDYSFVFIFSSDKIASL